LPKLVVIFINLVKSPSVIQSIS